MRIIDVKACHDLTLEVTFKDGIVKLYDMKKWLTNPIFSPLTNRALFETVKVEPGGYAISWTDQIDLSENEIWLNGQTLKTFHAIQYESPNHATTD